VTETVPAPVLTGTETDPAGLFSGVGTDTDTDDNDPGPDNYIPGRSVCSTRHSSVAWPSLT
jgi:hypothetical protein